jgi:hypothetical protein
MTLVRAVLTALKVALHNCQILIRIKQKPFCLDKIPPVKMTVWTKALT